MRVARLLWLREKDGTTFSRGRDKRRGEGDPERGEGNTQKEREKIRKEAQETLDGRVVKK